MKYYKKILIALSALFLLQCTPGDVVGPGNGGNGGTGISLSVGVTQNISNAAQQNVTLNWIPGPDDGYGVVDGFRATATDSLAQADTAFIPEPGRTHTFVYGPWPINTVISGAACVRAERRSLSSAYVCTGWSAKVDDQAPPAPIIDSVVATSAQAGSSFDITITTYYKAPVNDGGGAYTMAVYAKDTNIPMIDSSEVAVASLDGSQAIVLHGYTYGQTYNGQACVTATRRALFSQACASFVGFKVDQPPPPPQFIIKSIMLKPDSLMLTVADSGKTYQFCTFVEFADGMVAMRNPDKVIPSCVTEYQKLASVVRNPTAESQAIADTMQITYTIEQIL